MATVIGITGSFGSGKTTVARMFAKKGAHVIDADRVVKSLWKNSGIKLLMKKEFMTVNKKEVADIAFSDKNKLNKLNRIFHPIVARKIKREIGRSRKKFIVVDVPLLIEAKMQKIFDIIIVVSCAKPEQIKRLSERFAKHDILKRIDSQLPINDKIKYADFVIDNSASLSDTKKQFDKIWRCINEDSCLSGHV
jgi:dephospho-CoA kinase